LIFFGAHVVKVQHPYKKTDFQKQFLNEKSPKVSKFFLREKEWILLAENTFNML
jgi:hypothetical protein